MYKLSYATFLFYKLMYKKFTSSVELHSFEKSGRNAIGTKLPYIVIPNFPSLGHITALRFLEWVSENPEGVISLPTGKTPEHFIKWTQYHLNNWEKPEARKLREENGLFLKKKPALGGLHFVQIDEFYPINPKQHNSFYDYVSKFYIRDFGLNPEKALLINCDEIPLAEGKSYDEIFPNGIIDLTLRNREALTPLEKQQKESIFSIDNWCADYEQKIRKMGGIGFFLGGIGPDGHIAFNTLGSDPYSTTRLTATNFETQAASAGDLGGIEVSRTRLVITIGLGTITHNPEGVAIIFAAGEAKATVVKNALESEPTNIYPATVLQKLKNARFYITEGAAIKLKDSQDIYYKQGEWTFEKTEQAIFNLCQRINKYAHRLELIDLQEDEYCGLIPGLSLDHVQQVIDSTRKKMECGMQPIKNTTFLHTGPHHDDIMLGVFPNITQHIRQITNKFHFAVLTSGFTAVTNDMLIRLLEASQSLIKSEDIQMLKYPDFFEKGFLYKWDKDVSYYLDEVANENEYGKLRATCHRIIRSMVKIYGIQSTNQLTEQLKENIRILTRSYNGEKNPTHIQTLKGMLREFEEELVWAHYGVKVENVEHLRLGFYTGDIFTQQPERQRDVEPILEMLRRVNPDVISVAFDPEGAGPDTHYKVLQAIAEAIRQWGKETDTSKLKIIGYRNVWFRFLPSDANVFTPVSLNSMSVLNSAFKNCYISQVEASFPSYEYDGPFSKLSQRIWVEQFKQIQLVLGKNYFYEHENLKIRATHGMVYHKEMTVDEFLTHARSLEKSMEQFVN